MQVMVEDVMTRCPAAVSPQATIDEVLNTLVTEGLASVYVTTTENRLAGVVTDYDVLKHQVLGGDPTAKAETLMSRSVPTVLPSESAVALCPKFRDGSFARMAVIDKEGHLVGNVSRRELMRMMVAMERVEPTSSVPAAATPGTAIRSVPAPRGAQMARKPLATV
ncbi:MAG TPA: CBS domain-containing protein [Planctomycetaceae bacterium]|jgi:CBS domain-containing protein|nr:CBS domain-containing protein [Planctomycetaceae bacterium]